MVFTIEVGFTVRRPIRPDEKHHIVMVEAPTATRAKLIAAQMVTGQRGVVMATSTTVLSIEK